jgi:two-component system sensor histidine kinase/response regulator
MNTLVLTEEFTAKRLMPPDGVPASILVVDDTPSKLESIAAVISDMGLEVTKASSARDALRHLLKRDFAVILLDVKMPIMDGFETAALIHGRPRSAHTPIIFITAEADTDSDRFRGYTMGAVDYIFSPILPEVLTAKVRVFVDLFYLQRKLKLQAEELQRRSDEITNKNIELERASKAKSEFLANISHELRTPLNAIIGFTGTLLMKLAGPLTTDQDKQLKIVKASARHLLSLINDLLDVAKIEAGKFELNIQSVNCNNVLHELSETMRPMATMKGLGLKIEEVGENVCVHTDRRIYIQILINLINNAIKFTQEGEITVKLGQRNENGVLVTEVCVQDTGVGIKPEDQAKIFEAFIQADTTSTRRFEGTGLGLHLSRKLADLIGGCITLQSEYGKGSMFSLVISDS